MEIINKYGFSAETILKQLGGNRFNIKGYGTIDLKKLRGNIKDINTKKLHSERYYYLRGGY